MVLHHYQAAGPTLTATESLSLDPGEIGVIYHDFTEGPPVEGDPRYSCHVQNTQ